MGGGEERQAACYAGLFQLCAEIGTGREAEQPAAWDLFRLETLLYDCFADFIAAAWGDVGGFQQFVDLGV